jgi:hypothetical protein
MRGQERGVDARRVVAAAGCDVDVGRGGGIVPERQRAVRVQQRGDAPDVGDDAGDVRRRREGADLQRPVSVRPQRGLQRDEVDVPVTVLRDADDVGDRLPPRQLVAVVFERADEHDRSVDGGDPSREMVAVVELLGHPQPEDPHDLVDRPRRTRPAEDHQSVAAAADRVADDAAGVLAQPCGLQPGPTRLGVRVREARQHLVADEVLDEPERPVRRGVVGVADPARAVRAGHHSVVAQH